MSARPRRAAALLAAAALAACAAQAGTSRYCDDPPPLDASQQSRLLRVAAVLKSELEASGASVALLSRSGLDLDRFGQRYSHAGLSLKANPDAPWSVRQLYFACDERRPRLFDQGLAAFVFGLQSPALGYLSVLLLPGAAATAVERAALDPRYAPRLLSADYSANAYPFSTRYQNCNQWVAELLAGAWSGGEPSRGAAQAWLREQGYEPAVFDGPLWMFMLSPLAPWVHRDDHPDADLEAGRYRVTMPAALEAFVQRREPGATRLEFCHDETRLVMRRNGAPIADGCVPAPGDTVVALD